MVAGARPPTFVLPILTPLGSGIASVLPRDASGVGIPQVVLVVIFVMVLDVVEHIHVLRLFTPRLIEPYEDLVWDAVRAKELEARRVLFQDHPRAESGERGARPARRDCGGRLRPLERAKGTDDVARILALGSVPVAELVDVAKLWASLTARGGCKRVEGCDL